MILTCPECSTKYMSKDGSIGPNGRSVSCARCDAVWFVEGRDPDVLALKDNKAELLLEELKKESALNDELLPNAALQTPTVGVHRLMRDKADAEKLAKRTRWIRLIWAAPFLILIGAATSAVWKRQTIVENHPKAATLFQSIGLDVRSNGLDIRDLNHERFVVDGEGVLRVTGEVVNLTSKPISAPLVQFRLENRSGEALADWFVEPGTIPAGETVLIETEYPAPPIDGAELRYRFMPEE